MSFDGSTNIIFETISNVVVHVPEPLFKLFPFDLHKEFGDSVAQYVKNAKLYKTERLRMIQVSRLF